MVLKDTVLDLEDMVLDMVDTEDMVEELATVAHFTGLDMVQDTMEDSDTGVLDTEAMAA